MLIACEFDETGGVISGGNFNRVSHTKITLDNYTDFSSKKIRITVGRTTSEDAHQNIDAIQLMGSETRTEDPVSYKINYNNLKNKPAPLFNSINITSLI
jgi:hypothetical protein